jgi:hypothetical protein
LETTDWVTGELSQPEQAFDKALYLLDQDEGAKAEALLELVIAAARGAREQTLLARALCVLGEWLHEQGRTADARPLLTEVLQVQVAAPDDIAYEQRRARRILGNPEPGS